MLETVYFGEVFFQRPSAGQSCYRNVNTFVGCSQAVKQIKHLVT